ncbi:hypothetical protein NDA13_001944 [Ustilago tritici]|nr:hypothetical protein NDA13_001944 [Ustilago tritici]
MSSAAVPESTTEQTTSELEVSVPVVAYHTTWQWLPYAKHLKKSKDSTEALTAKDAILPYTELPPHQLDRRNLNFRITPGTV